MRAPAFVVFAVILFTRVASAEEPRVAITVDAADKARFEERRAGGDWVLLCIGACSVVVTPEPFAGHRVTLDGDKVDLHVAEGGPTRFRVTFPALLPRIGAATVTGVGYATASTGVFFLAVNAMRPDTMRARLPGEIDLRDAGLVMLGLGAVAAVVGSLWMLHSFRKPEVHHDRGVHVKLLPAPPPAREKTPVAGMPLPPPAAMFVPVLGGTFL
jgi:hypothetical protein